MASAEAPGENKLQGKRARRERAWRVMGKPLAWSQAFSTELASPSGSGSSAASLSPSALSGFTSSQLGDPGQAASLLSAFALGCLIPVWALEAPRVGAGPTMGPQLLLRCEAATATTCLLAGTEGAPRGR